MGAGVHRKEPLQKLKSAIGRALAEQMAPYQEECQAHTSKDCRAAGRGKRQVAERADVCWEGRGKGSRAQEKFQWTADIRAAMTGKDARASLGGSFSGY